MDFCSRWNRSWRPFAAIAIGAVVVVPAAAFGSEPVSGHRILGGHTTVAELAGFLGAVPSHCVAVDEQDEICGWRALGNSNASWRALASEVDTEDRVTVLCQLPKSGAAREKDSCRLYPARSARSLYILEMDTPRAKGRARHRKRVEAARERARSEFAEARTLAKVIRFVGDVPESCKLPGPGARSCEWRLTGRIWGHGAVASVLDLPIGKRLRLHCVFGPEGQLAEDCFGRTDD